MIDYKYTQTRIIASLQKRGPSLPIQVAKEVGTSSLFISAFLSELSDDKKVKISHMKVGGSPLYFLPGQENLLENFDKYLHPKEAEALLLLKNKKVLRDSEQLPAIRVALRSLIDFAMGFKENEEIYWRYAFTPENEIREIFNPKPESKEVLEIKETKVMPIQEEPEKKEKVEEKVTIEERPTEKEKIEEKAAKEEVKEKLAKKERIIEKQKIKPQLIMPKAEKTKKPKEEFENPLAVKEETQKKKEKPKSDFVKKVIAFLENKYKLIEEKECKAKEYHAIVQIKSELGPINLLTLAKDKKKTSDADLKKFLSEAQSIPLPALFVHTGDLSKKALEYAQNYFSILKILKI